MCKKSLLMMLLLALFAPWAANAQTLTVCDGTEGNEYIPLYGYYADTQGCNSEFIIPSSELTAMNGKDITAMTFYLSQSASAAWGATFQVYMKEVSGTTLDGLNGPDGCTIVFTGAFDGTGETMDVVFDENFSYHGGNLLIGTYVTSAGSWKRAYFYGIAATEAAYYYDGSWSSGVQNFLPKTTFTYEAPAATPKPSGLAVSDVTDNSATLNWNENGTATSWQICVNDDESNLITTSTKPYTLNNLTALTTYTVKVRSIGSPNSDWTNPLTFNTTAVAVAVGDSWSDDFEGTSCGWELINGTLTNQWCWGTATNNGGTHALYVSNDGGTSNAYTNNSAAMVYATKLLNFTEGKFEFAYNWMANGEGSGSYVYDYLRVALVPASVTLIAGTTVPSGFSASSLPTGWIAVDGGSYLNGVTAWQSQSVAVNVPAGNYYLVMAWRDDTSSGTNPPAAVDNVSITKMACPYDVTNLEAGRITTTGATLVWDGGGASQWQVAYSDNANFQNATEVTVSEATYSITGLTPSTVYYAKVRAYCGGTDFGAWCNAISFPTECDVITTYPYTENFDSYTAGAGVLPICWSKINTTTNTSYQSYPRIYNSNSHTSPNCLYFYSYAYYSSGSTSNDPQPQYAILPEMQNLSSMRVKLYARAVNTSAYYDATFHVGIMTDPADASTFTEVASFTPTATTYANDPYVIPFNTYTGNGNYIAIMMEGASEVEGYSYSYHSVFIDDITVEEIPSCLEPTGLAVNYVSGLTATVTWEGSAETYNIDVNGTVTEGVTSPYSIPGLEYETEYSVKVQANCGSSTSAWVGPVSFMTVCAPKALPYAYGFEDAGDLNCWQVIATSSSTGIASYTDAPEGSNVFRFYYTENNAYLASPVFNGTEPGLALVFQYMNSSTSTSYTEQFQVGYTTDASAAPADFIYGETIYGANEWKTYENNFPANTKRIAIKYIYTNGMYLRLDDFSFEVGSPCRKPTDLAVSEIGNHSAVLSWTENGEATAWNILCNRVLIENVTDNPYTLPNLDPLTSYTVQVCPVCEVEKWSDEISFTTDVACPAPTGLAAGDITSNSAVISWTDGDASYDLRVGTIESSGDRNTLFYDFEDGFGDWTNIDADGDGYPWMTLSNLSDYTSSYTNPESWAYEGSNAVLSGSFINGIGALLSADNYLVSPQVILGGSISFYAKGLDGDYPEHFGVAVSTTGTNPSDFVMVDEWDTDEDTEYHLYTVDLSAYSGMGYIALRNFCLGSDMYIVIIDNVTIEEGVLGEITWGEPITGVTNPYPLTGLDPETYYAVQVRANCGEDGYSEWAQVNFKTKGLCDVPTNLTATNVEARTATLNWEGVQDSYNVHYRTAGYREELFFTDFDSGIPEGWTNTGGHFYWTGSSDYFVFLGYTEAGTQYLITSDLTAYEGAATIEFKQGYYSDEMTFKVGFSSTTTDVDAFEWGEDVTATASETLYSVAIPRGAKYFGIQATSTEAETNGIIIDDFSIYGEDIPAGSWVSATANATTLDITGLTPEKEYEWQVQGVNRACDGGVTEWTELATFTTLPSCLVPTNLAYNNGVLSWTSTATLFDIQFEGEEVIEGVSNPYTPNLDLETVYYVRVRANCGTEDGYSDWTEYYGFVTDCSGAKDLPYAYGFEDAGEFYACWTAASFNTANNVTLTYDPADNTNVVFRFNSYSSASDYRQVLVSPELNTEAPVVVSFDYKTSNSSTETFQVGYCTSDTYADLADFTFGDAMSVNNNREWATYNDTLPAGTKYVAVLYSSSYMYYLYLDNFVFEEEAPATITQTTELHEGFNWFSIYVEGDPEELLAKLQEDLGEHGITIESLTDGLQENLGDGFWMGDLDGVGITSEQMYMIEVDADCTVELVGAPANPANHEITLNPGEVTWIGYPYSEEVDILVALSGLEAEEGDMIEGFESGVAEYLGDGFWMGFDTMVPGQGYMYTSNGTEVKTFVYNTEAEAKVRRAQKLGLGQHKFIKSLNSIIDTTKKNPNVIKKN